MSVTREEFDALLARVAALETAAVSVKSTPKKKVNNDPVSLTDIITRLEGNTWACTHCFKTGKNKDMFCASVSKLHYKSELITDNTEITREYYGEIRCSKHVNGSTNKGINHGAKLISSHYGIKDNDSVVTKDEENPNEQVAAVLSGNPASLVTTPSKAFSSKDEDKNYIEQGEFLHELVEKDEKLVIIQHHKSKDGNPKKRPSPCIIGVCETDKKDTYLENLSAPSDSIQASVGLKYSPLREKGSKEEEIGAGLTAVKQPVVLTSEDKPDAYEATTDPEDGDEDEDEEAFDKFLADLS